MSKILLMGDSHIAHMPKELIGNENDEVLSTGIYNIGVGKFRNNIWPQIKGKDFDQLVLLIGYDNIVDPTCDNDGCTTLDETIFKIKDFIKEVADSTKANVIVQSIYPTSYALYTKQIVQVNEEIASYCYELGVSFANIHFCLSDDRNSLKYEYSDGGFYLNQEGYKLVADSLNARLGVSKPSIKLLQMKNKS